jgi:hypothetical protein
VNLLVAAADLGALLAAVLLVLPAVGRTGLGIWHPALAWLALEVVFFGAGAAILAITEGRTNPAIYVGGAVVAFGLAVWGSNRVTRDRTSEADVADHATAARFGEPDPIRQRMPDPIRPGVVALLVAIWAAVLVPTILSVGIPFLAGDITGARSEVGGLDLQPLRVALPAAVLVAVLLAVRSGDRRARLVAGVAFAAAVVAELALASRYLSAELVAAIILGLGIARRPVPARALAIVGIVGAVLFVGIGILRAYDQAAGHEVDFALERTVNRVLLIEPRTLDALQATIPAEQRFFGGLTWARRLAPLFGRDDIPNLGYWIYPRLFPGQASPGYAAPGLIGEAWANFGWAGLAIFAALGVAVERFAALVAIRRRSVADIVAAALVTLFVARTHALGLDGLAVLVGLVIAWRLLAAPLNGLCGDIRSAIRWQT